MLDLKKLKIADDFDDGLKGQKVFDIVRFDKPQPNEWFKLFDLGEGMKSFANVVLTKQRDAKGSENWYLMTPEIAAVYKDYLKPYTRSILTYGYTAQGLIFIWPVNYNPNHQVNWHDSAKKIALAALHEWTQMQADNVQKTYAHLRMNEKYEKEVKDPFNNKPPLPYEAAVEKALVNRIVDSEDHALIRGIGVKA
jgi:hypothetical protein